METEQTGQDPVTKQLEERLTVKRPFYQRFIDQVYETGEWARIGMITAGALAFFYIVGYLGHNSYRQDLIQASQQTTPEITITDPSSVQTYVSRLESADSAQAAPKVLEAVLYAVENTPEYVKQCKMDGKVGIIPLDPAEVGVRADLIENDPALCLALAGEKYQKIRQSAETDEAALTVFFSSRETYEEIVSEVLEDHAQVKAMRGRIVSLMRDEIDKMNRKGFAHKLPKDIEDVVLKAKAYLQNGN